MIRQPLWLSLFLCFVALAPAAVRAQESGPPLELTEGFASVRLYPKAAPDLRFYATPKLTGSPVLRVDEHGAWLGGRLVCSWPEGEYDQSDEANMVLGYRTRPERGGAKYDGCPKGYPFVSMWGDHGVGGAAQFIEVFARKGSTIQVRFQGKRYYLDLNTLVGDPREPDRTLKRRQGFLGWQWEGPTKGWPTW